MLRSFLSNAELFLDQTKGRWKTAKARAVARGAHIGPTWATIKGIAGALGVSAVELAKAAERFEGS